MNLSQLHEIMKKLLHIEDTKIIDLVLAIALSKDQQHSKLWLIIIGRSGDGKTEFIKCLDDNEETTKVIRQFTSKTLVNGFADKKKFEDLAPKLKDKILLIPEMASILTASQEERNSIWAQLRDLYDGIAGKQSGLGADIDYNDLNVTFIGCSTPNIDNHTLLKNALGTRELYYRCEDKDDNQLMNKIVENSVLDKDELRQEIKRAVKEFLTTREFKEIELSKETENDIKEWALLTTKLRACADIDNKTGELNNLIYPEAPSRILEQLITLFRALKSLDEGYTDEKALEIIQKVVFSSSDPIRIEILKFLMRNWVFNDGFSKNQISVEVDVSPFKAFSEMNILASKKIELVKKGIRINEMIDKKYTKFSINKENKTVQFLAKKFNIDLGIERIKEIEILQTPKVPTFKQTVEEAWKRI